MNKSANREWIGLEPSQTVAPRRSETSLIELFEAQVERTPRATALVYGDRQCSYRELNERANRLAHYLVQSGVKAEDRIGILMERTPAIIVSLLGVLKAGGCYLPLDPHYPQERLKFMRTDAGLRVLLTTGALAEACGLEQNEQLRLVYVEEVEQAASSENLGVAVSKQQLAYLIYTSGSTGVPKGVAITHGSAVSFIHWASESFDQQALSGVLFSTSICFDLSIFEVFVTLSNGGKVILAENALQLPESVAASQVTLINTVPSAMAELVRMRAVPESVRVVNLAGEALRPELVAEIYANTQVQEVYNLYGPSEDTTYSTYTAVRAGEPVTIGRPIANTNAYVLNELWQIVPVGVAGELHLGGKGLARGYWRRPELTAAKFIPDHFSGEAGARLYRTGDLARYLASGELEFLGRVDQQVKVRGFRIELGEIEVVLASYPGVREAVVVVKEDKSGDKRLVAYLAVDGEETTGKVLRGHLRERLPEYMVPQAFVSLPALPLTPNGKVDRRALQALEVEFEGSGGPSVMARTPMEEILLAIWLEVLGRETVSVHDSFFELGGHSLSATQVISRIRDVFRQEVTLRALFENPTVASLARAIEGGQLVVTGPQAPPIVRVERHGSAPASFAQQRLWLLDQLEPGCVFYNIPTVTKLTGTLIFEALEDALTEIIRRHEVLRTTFTSVDGEPWQIISPAEPFRLPLIDLSERPDKERETEMVRLISEEAQRPFDLAREPLLRGKVLRLGAREHVVLLTAHHIVLDLWSISILIREVATLYRAFYEGRPSPLEELPVQYADFAHWQRQWFQEELEQHLHYWRQQLAGAPAALELKGKKPTPAILTFRVAKQTFELSKESVQKLRELGRQTGVTLFMSLLAAFDVLLYRYSGQTDLLIGTPIANRNHLATEPLIGFFVNTLVLRADLSGDPTFIEVLQRVREVCLEAYAHQELPFVKLVEELQPDRRQIHSSLFQVMFVMHNIEIDALELPGLSLSVYQEENKTTKFDLLLSMWETDDGMGGFLKYNTDVFDDSTIAKMVEHFQTLIENLLADPQQHLSDSSFLTEDETMGLSSADFPESGLSQKDFESLILQLNSSSSLK